MLVFTFFLNVSPVCNLHNLSAGPALFLLFNLLLFYFIYFLCCTNCFLTLPVIKRKWIEKPLIHRHLRMDCTRALIFPPAMWDPVPRWSDIFIYFFVPCIIFIILRGHRKAHWCSRLQWRSTHSLRLTHTHTLAGHLKVPLLHSALTVIEWVWAFCYISCICKCCVLCSSLRPI